MNKKVLNRLDHIEQLIISHKSNPEDADWEELQEEVGKLRKDLKTEQGKTKTQTDNRNKLLNDLKERYKELNCLYKLSCVAIDSELSMQEIFQEALKLIPESWQFPEHTAARITYNDQEFQTGNFEKTQWVQSANIENGRGRMGSIEVYYLEKKPTADEGPFLKEERDLLNTFAALLSDIIKRKETENHLKASEHRASLITENTSSLISLIDPGGSVDYASPSHKNLGYNPDKLINTPGFNLIHPDDKPQLSSKLEKANAGKLDHINIEFKILNTDGSYHYMEGTFDAIRNPEGKLESIIMVADDITSRKKVEEALRESEQKYRDLVEDLGEGIVIMDKNFNINFANPAAESIMGVERGGLTNRSVRQFTNATSQRKIEAEITKRAHGKKSSYEIELVRPDGATRWVQLTAVPKFDQQGNFQYSMGIIRDITQNKIYYEELVAAKEMAEESDRLKSAFLAIMSHELRTPLNAIIGFSNLIENELPVEESKEYLQIINREGHHLLEIIESMFDISILETKEATLNNDRFILKDFFNLLDTEITSIKSAHGKDHLEINKHLPESYEEVELNADESKLKRAMHVLLDNAVKFTSEGHVEYGITINDQQPVFYVSDTGIGIPKDQQAIIFKKFRMVDESHTRQYGGVGLGLALCNKIADLLRGKVWVKSEEGAGATFKFALPNTSLKTEVKMEEKESKSGNPNLTGKQIIIAEDEETNFEFLNIMLRKLGATIYRAYNGKEAIKLASENKDIDLIIMDIKMPVMNGYTATQKIREFNKEAPIIAVTAYAMAGDDIKAKEAGCDDHLSKPFRKEKLMRMINKYMRAV